MFPWTDWPRSASEQLEQAYVREHTRVTVQVYSRDIWSGYNVWARTRASTLDDSDDENDLTNPEEVLTLIIDLETDNGTEYYEAVSMVNANGKGGGPCHTFRVKRTCRGLNGELLRGNFFGGSGLCFVVVFCCCVSLLCFVVVFCCLIMICTLRYIHK